MDQEEPSLIQQTVDDPEFLENFKFLVGILIQWIASGKHHHFRFSLINWEN